MTRRRHSSAIAAFALLGSLMGPGLFEAPAANAHEREHAGSAREPDVAPAPDIAPALDGPVDRAGAPSQAPSTGSAHEHRHREKTGIARVVAWLGNFHPLMVHFPIGMLVGAAIAEALLLATRRERFDQAGRFCLWVGAIAAVPTALLGWLFAGFAVFDDDWLLTTHRWLGTLTAVWAAVVLMLRERARRGRHRPALFLGALLALGTGFFGGALVHGLDHYAW